MRKDLLEKLIGQETGPRSQLVSTFLQSKKKISLSNEDISFSEFITYLQENLPLFVVHLENSFAGKNDTELFTLFVKTPAQQIKETKEEKEKKPNLLNKESALRHIFNQQNTIMKNVVAPFLDSKSVIALSSCHSALYRETKHPAYWKDKLIAAGCHPDLLKKVINANVIRDYKILFRVLMQQHYCSRISHRHTWELFGLSGDPKAIIYAVETEKVTAETKNRYGATLAHYAAWSGSSDAIQTVLALKDAKGQLLFDPKTPNNNGTTLLHYAAWSGSSDAIQTVLALKDAKGQPLFDPQTRDNHSRTLLHFAAWSGSPDAIQTVLAMKDAKGQLLFDPKTPNSYGTTLAHYAAWSGSPDAIQTVLALKDAKGQPAFDPKTRTNNSTTLLHFAAWSGLPEAVNYIRLLSYDFNLGFDAKAQNNELHDAFWFADQSGNGPAIRNALLTPIETLVAQRQAKDEKPSSSGQEVKEERKSNTKSLGFGKHS